MKVILLTSANPEEGKSFTTLNLASAFAEIGKKVYLISGDLRKPKLHEYLDVSNAKGLSAYLAGYLQMPEDIIHRTCVPRLFLIPSGPTPPNPVELLESKRMEEFMADIKKKADFIFLDTPPILKVTDAAVLARYADGVVVLSDCLKTTKEDAKQLVNSLNKTSTRKIGVILNRVILNNSYYRYYYTDYKRSRKH